MANQKNIVLGLAVGLLAGVGAGCNADPGFSEQTPLYRSADPKTAEENETTSGERGSVQITEINWAGSVTDDGTHDWDDEFIELQNKSERTLNLTDWRLQVRGDHDDTFRIPEVPPISTNEYLVIATKKNGAFGEVADAFIEELDLGRQFVKVRLKDADERLMGSAGSEHQEVFTGGWDTVTVRSMERVQLLFTNSGSSSRAWHAYSDNEGLETIAEGYRQNTLASPGQANSTDYSGSTSSGNFN